MQIEKIKSDGLSREYDVTVKAEDVTKKIESRLKEVGMSLQMPGFRPGKVPKNIVKKKYGKNIQGEVLEQLVKETTTNALLKEKIRPAMSPDIEVLTFEEGEDLKYKMKFEVFPEVPEIDYDSISIEVPKVDVSDKDVTKSLKDMAADIKDFQPLEKKRPAQNGDALVIDFKGFVDDKAFEGGEAKGHQLELGSGAFITGFEEQLIDLNEGDKKDVHVTFPEEYHSEELAGKKAKFEVEVHEILEFKKQEMNDELAKKVGLEDLAELNEKIKEQMETEVKEVARTISKRRLFDILDNEYKFTVPQKMVDLEYESILAQVKRANNSNPDSEDAKKSEEEIENECKTMAERRVRLGILLAECGNKNNIIVNQEEVNRAIFEEARKYRGQEEKIFDFYKNHPTEIESLKGPILEEKVVDFALEKVTLVEKELTLEELQNIEE